MDDDKILSEEVRLIRCLTHFDRHYDRVLPKYEIHVKKRVVSSISRKYDYHTFNDQTNKDSSFLQHDTRVTFKGQF